MAVPKVAVKKAKIGEKAFHGLGVVERTLKKGPIFPLLIVMSAVLYFIMLVLSGFAANPKSSFGLFKHSISNVSRMYSLNITPAGWTFSIWGLIYLLQIGSVIYSIGLLFRHVSGGPAYLNPPVLSPLYFVLFSLSSVFVSGWLFMWDRLMFYSSTMCLMCCVLYLWTAFSIASERFTFYRPDLAEARRGLDIVAIFVTVVNGLGIYATWTVVATLLNIGVVLVYRLEHSFSNETASIICLSFLALFLVLYSSLDMTVFEKNNRFTYTPYFTLVWALTGVVSGNWDAEKASAIMSAVLLGCSVVALLVKIGLSIARLNAYENPYRRMKVATPMN